MAVAVRPLPAMTELIVPVVLTAAPAATPSTFTVMVQVPLAGTVPFTMVITPVAETAVVPPQEENRPLGVATSKLVGRVSTTPASVMAAGLGLRTVIVNDVMVFTGKIAAPNALLINSGVATTVVAVAVLPTPPSLELTAPVTLICVPRAMPVTLSMRVQLLLPGMVPPVRETVVPAAVAVPPHVLTRALGVATTKPAGNTSVKPTPTDAAELELLRVNVRLVTPPRGNTAAPKALLMDGGADTVRLAVAAVPVIVVTPPASTAVGADVVFTLTPAVVACTVAVSVHVNPPMRKVPEYVTDVSVEVGTKQLSTGRPTNCKPAGSVSL